MPFRYVPPRGGAEVYSETARAGVERRSEAFDLTHVRFAVFCRGSNQDERAQWVIPLNPFLGQSAP